jgi:hypothetical protein
MANSFGPGQKYSLATAQHPDNSDSGPGERVTIWCDPHLAFDPSELNADTDVSAR